LVLGLLGSLVDGWHGSANFKRWLWLMLASLVGLPRRRCSGQ